MKVIITIQVNIMIYIENVSVVQNWIVLVWCRQGSPAWLFLLSALMNLLNNSFHHGLCLTT